MGDVVWVSLVRDPSGEDDPVACCTRCLECETMYCATALELDAFVRGFEAQHRGCVASVHSSTNAEVWP